MIHWSRLPEELRADNARHEFAFARYERLLKRRLATGAVTNYELQQAELAYVKARDTALKSLEDYNHHHRLAAICGMERLILNLKLS